MKTITFMLGLVAFISFFACKKSSNNASTTVDCNGSTAKFSSDASPVLMSKCATNSGCHANGASNNGGVLTNYSQINAKKAAIRASILNGSMPQGSSLTTAEKQAIVCWIDNGALNN
jgi:hypothetical protein